MSPGRAAALSVRSEVERGRRLDRAFNAAARRLDPRERAFAHELTYGVTRLRGRLDHLIAPHVHRGIEGIDATVLEILRLGAYQLLEMGGVPTYAAVSESVDQVRDAVGDKPAGFVNAVLRNVEQSGAGPDRFPSADADPLGALVASGSHPRWLVERWLDRWPVDDVRRLTTYDNRPPATYLVALDGNPDGLVQWLSEHSIGASALGEGSSCVRLDARDSVSRALEVAPRAIVQDPAANLVARYADVPPGTIVADLCAAPGGKALALSDGPARLLAIDRSESRLRIVSENARRTGRRMDLIVADARRPPLVDADVVLLDAPCTGTGTLARHPDARWRLTPDSVDELATLQKEMLAAAGAVVREGGLLVYSTCTLEPEENEGVVEDFLREHPTFVIAPTDAVPSRFVDDGGRLFVTPQDSGFDGAFAARLRRIA